MNGLPAPELRRPRLAARYVYGIQSGQFIKIGVTFKVSKRLADMRALNPHPLSVVFRRKLFAPFACERKMHEILKLKSIGREWFDVTIEEVKAAAIIGAAYAREVYLCETMEEVRLNGAYMEQSSSWDAGIPIKTGTS